MISVSVKLSEPGMDIDTISFDVKDRDHASINKVMYENGYSISEIAPISPLSGKCRFTFRKTWLSS